MAKRPPIVQQKSPSVEEIVQQEEYVQQVCTYDLPVKKFDFEDPQNMIEMKSVVSDLNSWLQLSVVDSMVINKECSLPDALKKINLKDDKLVYSVLEKLFQEKISLAKQNKDKYLKLKNIIASDRWGKLAASAQADLDYLLLQKSKKLSCPEFKFLYLAVNKLDCNYDLGSKTLEVNVLKGIKYPLLSGVSLSDLSTYVRVELPTKFPITAISDTVCGSDDPEYNFTSHFEFISRGDKSLNKALKTRGLKFDVFCKKDLSSSIRDDVILGSAELKLEALDNQCTLQCQLPLCQEHSKKLVGGHLEVKIRVSERLDSQDTDKTELEWLVLQQADKKSVAVSAALQDSLYVLKHQIRKLKPAETLNSHTAKGVYVLETKLKILQNYLNSCSTDELRDYCSHLQKLKENYESLLQNAKIKGEEAKLQNLTMKKSEIENEISDLKAKLSLSKK